MSRWIITGGAGFIGTNLVQFLAHLGDEVLVLDDFSKPGTDANARNLRLCAGVQLVKCDITNRDQLWKAIEGAGDVDSVVHLAAQVSLMASIGDPFSDFMTNAVGSLNLLEFFRLYAPDVPIIGVSSNKVYGDLSWVRYIETATRFAAPDFPYGFDEETPLSFQGPYGCSKGAMDQYFADYARTFGMRTAVLRQSSVYGPHQHPRFDQGWVSFLIHEAIAGRPVKLSGPGKQVRDLLYVKDFCELMPLLPSAISPGVPNLWNCGGGPANSMSILELFLWLKEAHQIDVSFQLGDMRPSDQRVYVSNIHSLSAATGWRPQIQVQEGLEQLLQSINVGRPEK